MLLLSTVQLLDHYKDIITRIYKDIIRSIGRLDVSSSFWTVGLGYSRLIWIDVLLSSFWDSYFWMKEEVSWIIFIVSFVYLYLQSVSSDWLLRCSQALRRAIDYSHSFTFTFAFTSRSYNYTRKVYKTKQHKQDKMVVFGRASIGFIGERSRRLD